jgi:hypothetical protein
MAHTTDLCILFLYHKCDALTLSHLARLRESNPDASIIPLTDGVPELIPDSVDVSTLPAFSEAAGKWRSIDGTLYRWFVNREFDARRYVVIEYDCQCNVELRAYYDSAGPADVVGVDFFTRNENPRWDWFKENEVNKLPVSDRPYASGIVPFTCTMFSHEALLAIVSAVTKNDVFCELRLGTAVNKLGLRFRALPFPQRSTISWHPYPWQANRNGLFHGIKSVDHNEGKRSQPGVVGAKVNDIIRSMNRNRKYLPFVLQARRQKLRKLLSFGMKRG